MLKKKTKQGGDFPGGPVVKTSHFYYRGCEFDPWWGTKIPHALRHSQRIIIIFLKSRREFPGGLVIRSPFLLGKVTSHKPCPAARKQDKAGTREGRGGGGAVTGGRPGVAT